MVTVSPVWKPWLGLFTVAVAPLRVMVLAPSTVMPLVALMVPVAGLATVLATV